jgi:hypothetical protein
MKNTLLSITATLAFVPCAFAYQLDTKLTPDPAIMGKQALVVQIKDDQGKPDAKAKITAKAIMPATPDMMEMLSTGKIENLGKGKHEVKFNISMEGKWMLNLEVGEGKTAQTFTYEMNTGKPGLKKVKP